MKKFIVAAIAAVCSLSASAQIWVGGALGLNVNTPDGGKAKTTLTITPTVGYQLSEKWDLGLELQEILSSQDGNTSNTFVVNPFARFSFAKFGIATFFVDGGFGVGAMSQTVKFSDGKTIDNNSTYWNVGFRPGVKFEVTEHLELESKLGLIGVSQVVDSYTNVGLSVSGEALSLGLIYKF